MKLNLLKCAFGVELGKFLGFMVSEYRIESNLEKVEVIEGMPSPHILHEVQRLAGQEGTLNRFIAQSTDRCLPFFKILRKA